MKDRCFGVQNACAKGSASCAATASEYKYKFVQGVKNAAGQFVPSHVTINPTAAGDNPDSATATSITIGPIQLNSGEIDSIGASPFTATELTLGCGYTGFAATGSVTDVTTAAGVALPTTLSATPTITGTLSTACKTSTTSKSGAFNQVLATFGMIAAFFFASLSFE